MEQFGRRAEVILGSSSYMLHRFKIEFNVEFDDQPDLNHAEIKIYNLSSNSINQLSEGLPVVLNAGYQQDVGGIFLGALYKHYTEWSGVDKITTIKAVDASDQLRKVSFSRSYKAGTNAGQIITDVARAGGLSIGALSLPRNPSYSRGKTVNGRIPTILKELARDCGAKFHIAKGQAFFRGGRDGDNIRFRFTPTRGLIGSPEPFEEERDERIISGYNMTALLNHRIQADSIFNIESRYVNGQYRVMEGSHVLAGNDFYTHIKAV
ncbi:hypothetical protein [Geomicrobium sp. JCM 19055]|uniref:phage protein n=1 Tax=Geomicrobium sp. JCM 19055 TaxID=1460649 RepID=UPI0006942A1C|nr:hypothetical protein [Geomicrobium sp. JCM 19055]